MLRTCLLVIAALLAMPAAAQADGTLSFINTDSDYIYTGDHPGTHDNVSVETGVDVTGLVGYYFRPLDGTTIAGGCDFADPGPGVVCGIRAGDRIVLNLLTGNDAATLQLSSSTSMGIPALPALVNGGTGNDDILGGPVADTLNGDAGNDVLRLLAGADTLSGGPGVDLAVLAFAGPATVTVDGLPNDGPANANILADVENVDGTPTADSLTGSNEANRLRGLGGADALNGLGGADVLDGGADNDLINARDLAVDTVICGAGNDTANVDFNDSVAADCETVRRTARPIVDGDGDGSLPPDDCDDTNPKINRDARDKPQNGVDEDCSGKDADWRRNRTVVSTGWLSFTDFTRVTRLTLSSLPARAEALLRCKGGGCPFSKKALKVRKRKASATKPLKGRHLSPGAVLEIRVTAPATIGKIVRYTIRRHALPQRRQLCLPPGQKKPGRCG